MEFTAIGFILVGCLQSSEALAARQLAAWLPRDRCGLAIGEWNRQSATCYDDRRPKKSERISCREESLPVNRPAPGVKIRSVWRGRCPARKPRSGKRMQPMARTVGHRSGD